MRIGYPRFAYYGMLLTEEKTAQKYASNYFFIAHFKYSNQAIIFEFAIHCLPLSFFKFVMYYFIIKKQ